MKVINVTITLTDECATARPAALVGKIGVSWYQAKPIQNPALRAGPRHNRPTSALEPDSWLQLRGAMAAGQRHLTASALSRPCRKGTDPLTQFEHASWTRVKEALDKAKILKEIQQNMF